MTGPAYQREQDVAVAAVREAARLCQAVQSQIASGVIEKKDRSPVTVADFGSQALVCRALRDVFPEDPIIAEEDATALRQPDRAPILAQVVRHVQALQPGATREAVLDWIDYGNAQTYSDRFWTLDPIDGTKGFLRREQYAVALALIVKGHVVVAALACPNLPAHGEDVGGAPGGVYAAIQGQGTRRLPIAASGPGDVVKVSILRDTMQARFCESVESGHSSHSDAAAVAERLGITAPPVRLDSQAKYAVVAHGEADIYLRLPTRPGYVEKIWDHAAGSLVVTEAGGTVTDVAGAVLEFHHGKTLQNNRGVVVSNGPLHAPVLAALETVGIG